MLEAPGSYQGHLYLYFIVSNIKSFIHLLEREMTTTLRVQALDASEFQCQFWLLLLDLELGGTHLILLNLSAFRKPDLLPRFV